MTDLTSINTSAAIHIFYFKSINFKQNRYWHCTFIHAPLPDVHVLPNAQAGAQEWCPRHGKIVNVGLKFNPDTLRLTLGARRSMGCRQQYRA